MSNFYQDRTIAPDALRSPELHDFNDLPAICGGNRFPLIIFVVAALLTGGHLLFGNPNAAPARVAQQSVLQTPG